MSPDRAWAFLEQIELLEQDLTVALGKLRALRTVFERDVARSSELSDTRPPPPSKGDTQPSMPVTWSPTPAPLRAPMLPKSITPPELPRVRVPPPLPGSRPKPSGRY